MQPFGNLLVSMTLTGAQIDTLLEQQWSTSTSRAAFLHLGISNGVTFEWSRSAPVGQKIDPDGNQVFISVSYSWDGNLPKEGFEQAAGEVRRRMKMPE